MTEVADRIGNVSRQCYEQLVSRTEELIAQITRALFALRPKGTKGFVVLPRRREVERTIGWCMNARRNARDYKRLPQHSEAHLNWGLVTMMTRPLTRNSLRTSQWASAWRD
ncbi:hypothetical protein ACWDCB_33230 [Streptomyces sp. NPDC001178]